MIDRRVNINIGDIYIQANLDSSPINVFGKVDGDEQIFRNVSAGMLVQIEAVE